MNAISERLASSSFPPLHPCLLFAPTTPYSKAGSLSERQVEALQTTVYSILDEFDRRGDLVQTLVVKNTQAEQAISDLQHQIQDLKESKTRTAKQESKAMDHLYMSEQQAKEELTSCRLELVQARDQLDAYQRKYEQGKKKVDQSEKDLADMKEALESLIEKASGV